MAFMRHVAVIAFLAACIASTSCSKNDEVERGSPPDPAVLAQSKTPAVERALRRAYNGAPPTIPHAPFGIACTSCHNRIGMEVPNVGFAPPMPHEETSGLAAISRCNQCHVYKTSDAVFRPSSFVGRPQDLRKGTKQHEGAPPVIPHPVFMRENCQACHTGNAAREEIRCTHPERTRCLQCHLEMTSSASTSFRR
ncbi:MAG: hypothetical protein H6832_15035 [Planctomycetes bacterium]|nr:hypothetical protein [Planctomycetota bacterium]